MVNTLCIYLLLFRAADLLIHSGNVVTLKVAKQAALSHGLGMILDLPSPSQQEGKSMFSSRSWLQQEGKSMFLSQSWSQQEGKSMFSSRSGLQQESKSMFTSQSWYNPRLSISIATGG